MQHDVEELKLPNGSCGLIIDVPGTQVVEFRMFFRAGGYLCPVQKAEIAHFTEHLTAGGANEAYPNFREFDSEITKNGAYYNGHTSGIHMFYSLSCAAFEIERTLSLLIGAITKPLFLKKDFTSELKVIQNELKQFKNDYYRILMSELDQRVGFAGSYTAQESLDSLERIALTDLQDFYRQTHFTGNMQFIIAGGIKAHRQKIVDLLSNLSLPQKQKNQPLDLPTEGLHGLSDVLGLNYESVTNLHYLFYAFSSQRMSEYEKVCIWVLNHLLFGNFKSRIYGQAREKGLIYGSGAYWCENTASSSHFGIYNQIVPENAEAMFDLIRQEITQILNGYLASKEVEYYKKNLLGKHYLHVQTLGDLINVYKNDYISDDRVIDYKSIPDQIQAVTPRDIVRTFQKFFLEGKYALGLLGSAADQMKSKLQQKISL